MSSDALLPEPYFASVPGTLFTLAFIIIFMYMTWYSAQEWGKYSLLVAYGQRTRGKITSRRSSHSRTARFFVTYVYRARDLKHHLNSYEREQQVSWRNIERIKYGELVDVLYLPNKPTASRLAGVHTDNTARDTSSLVAAIGILIFPYMMLLWLAIFLIVRFGRGSNFNDPAPSK